MSNDETNLGVLPVVGAVLWMGLAYGVASAGPPPSMNFAVAEGLLLLSVLVMVIGLVVKPSRPR